MILAPRGARARSGLALAFLGAAGALVQVLIVRRGSAALGGGALTSAAVLGATLIGIGLGAAIGGWLADRGRGGRRALRLAQGGLIVHALALPAFLRAAGWIFEHLVSPGAPPFVGSGVAAVLLWMLALPPALAVGAGVPLLACAAPPRVDPAGERFASYYGWDTAGAALGALLAAFWILPRLGTAGLALAAVLASALGALFAPRDPAVPATPTTAEPRGPLSPGMLWIVSAGAFASGFASVGLQLLWARSLAVRLAGSTYSFATVTGTYLLGLALGAFAVAAWERHRARGRGAAIALSFAATIAGWLSLPVLAARLQAPSSAASDLLALVAHEAGLAALVLLPGCFVLGALFPALVRAAAAARTGIGVSMGRVYLTNALGAGLAPFVVGWVLLPALGIEKALLLVGAAPAAAGACALLVQGRVLAALGTGAGTALLAFVLAGVTLPRGEDPGATTIERRESLLASVAVLREPDGNLVLGVDHGYRLGDTAGAFRQRRQGVLPLLIHGDAERVLFAGVGTGSSVGAAVALDGRVQVDACELLPPVLDLLPHFATVNYDLAERARRGERVRLWPVDARRFLRSTDERFDVVVGDLYLPWLRGEGSLYAREHLERLAAALDDGGLVCQWLPLFQTTGEGSATIVATFLEVFPEVQALWLFFNAEAPVVGLLGSRRPIVWSQEALERALRRADPAVLEAVALERPSDVAALRICGRPALESWARNGAAGIDTGTRPRQEFLAVRALLRSPEERVREVLPIWLACQRDPGPVFLADESTRRRASAGPLLMAARAARVLRGDREDWIEGCGKALRSAPDWVLAVGDLEAALQESLAQVEPGHAERAAEILAEPGPYAWRGYLWKARLALGRGDRAAAALALRSARELAPGEPELDRLEAEIRAGR